MPDSLTSEPESAFVCDCEERMRSACARQPFYKEHEGKGYCVLHFPSREKSADFKHALQRKLENKDFNFRGVWFPDEVSFSKFGFGAEADFLSATFSAEADFRDATFSAAAVFAEAAFSAAAYFRAATFSAEAVFVSATFSWTADFSSATFSAEADFCSAGFSAAAYFNSATFSAAADFRDVPFNVGADFSLATFSAEADFSSATFSAETDFSVATFGGDLRLCDAVFQGYVKFAGDEDKSMLNGISSLGLRSTKFEQPDHVSFQHLIVRPHWFVFVNTRQFEFVNVRCRFAFTEEIERLKESNVLFPYVRLSRTFRDLAINCEERHRYKEASRFRYFAMETNRRERWRGLALWRLSWWYWLASGYGEQVWQAFAILLGILLLSALLYTRVGFVRWEPKLASEADAVVAKRDEVGAPLKFSRALTYSAGVMTFQKPEPRPATTVAQTVVLLETILGPVQAALLALAIRRKFMR